MRATAITRYLLGAVAAGMVGAVTAAALGGCGAAPRPAPAAPPAAPAAPPPAGAAAPAPAPVVAPQEALLDHVPASALAAVVVRRGSLGLVDNLLRDPPALRRELSAYLTREMGFDPTAVEGAVAWASSLGGRRGALFLRLREGGALRGRRAGTHRGVDLIALDQLVVAASVPGGVVVGSPTEVAGAIDLATGHAGRVTASSPLGFMLDPRARDADLLAGVHLPSVADPGVRTMVQGAGLRSALVSYTRDGLVTLRVNGDAARLGAVRELLRAGVGLILNGLEKTKDQAMRERDVGAAVGAIVGFYQAQRLYQEVEPRIEGSSLVSRYRLPQLAMSETFFVVGGMMAAIAIPAFVKYIRRAKASEARASVQRIAAGARAFHEPRRRAPRRFAFPASTPWSPSADCCKTDGKCAPDPAAWRHPTWKALGFDLPGAHFYQYRFTSEGKGKQARFTVEARGDLDCNGTSSSFRLRGQLGADGAVELKPLEVERETE